jgi:hypothetical protein
MPLYKINSTGDSIMATQNFMDSEYTDDYILLPSPRAQDPAEWLIDLGSFYDRFALAKLPLLASQDTQVIALLRDLNVRRWVDLRRTDVIRALEYCGSIVPELTVELINSVLTQPVAPNENNVVRTLYFKSH